MSTFTQRTTAPTTDNRYYYADNPFYQSGYGLPNCTCYAFGRFWELTGGTMPSLSCGNAEEWYGKTDGYSRGQTPKLGAIACWRKGVAGVNSDGAGHVAIVEQINADGSIVTSDSGYGASSLWWRSNRANDSNWGAGSAYTFQGFIYNPIDFEGDSLTYVSGNRYLTIQEMETNAFYIWDYLGSRGWTQNAVAGMLGNMEEESTINPGIWQGLNEGEGPAFGLVQWDPFTKYTDWCAQKGIDPAHMDSALQRLEYELENGLQYYPTDDYPLTFKQFKVSTESAGYLAMAFLRNYERPANPNQPRRAELAEYWYNVIGSYTPGSGDPDPDEPEAPDWKPKGKKLSLLLMVASTRRHF